MSHFTTDVASSFQTLRSAHLLVVDDDPLVRELHAILLQSRGYKVRTAKDGVEALEHLAEQPFDLMLTDLFMPRLNGATLLLALRSAGSRMPVIMVSGTLAFEPLPSAIARELFTFIPKPAYSAELLSAVEGALKSAKFRQSTAHDGESNAMAA